MKNMRKLTALLLAVVMVLSLSATAFARDGGTISSATINTETATTTTIDGVNYVRATRSKKLPQKQVLAAAVIKTRVIAGCT